MKWILEDKGKNVGHQQLISRVERVRRIANGARREIRRLLLSSS